MAGGWLKASLLLSFMLPERTLAFSDAEKEDLVNAHNEYRSRVTDASYMLRMRWDNDLSELALTHAKECIWGHNENRGPTGENLYAVTGTVDLKAAVEKWHLEGEDYTYDTMECTPQKMCGHYTQVVWADSDKVGCASHYCDVLEGLTENNLSILVCNYSPPGNVIGEKPYKKGSPCSECPDGYKCVDNLCTSEQDLKSGPETQTVKEEEMTEPTPEAKAEPNTEPEAKPEPTPEVEAEPTPGAKAEPTPEVKTEPTSGAKVEPNTEPEAKPEPTPEAKTEPTPGAKVEPNTEPEAKPEPNTEPEAKPEQNTEHDENLQPKMEPGAEPESNPDLSQEIIPILKPKLEPRSKSEVQTGFKPDSKKNDTLQPSSVASGISVGSSTFLTFTTVLALLHSA